MTTADVDFNELSTVASRLDASAETMGAIAAPAAIAAGAGAASTAAILAHLTRNAANICDALEISAAGVRASRATYADVDQRSSGALGTIGSTW